ncbi:MAG TPA: tRNA (N6-threonylcarbamoyladenosine(37)-N6)-methyltransferase TrmO [Ruminococcus sp.]|jgi:tRNA-Thr(GGU) m(6)t(6)A37 methyltransferase TsaA|nr:tRNA (N6-threonylcarbamoyladenosine(37)-N6)-methyltransferase TrmO [Ruminococcus sp.]
MNIEPIAVMHTDFQDKFGIPRQSGRVPELMGKIVFFPEFRREEAFRGIEEFSHLWVIFDFSESHREEWSPTVRPPRLGGNKRLGVFATRSPFRPNPLGLSCVKLERLEHSLEEGTALIVSGVDLLDGTPIFDIKPYIPYADSRLDAKGSYAEKLQSYQLNVVFPPELLHLIPIEKQKAVCACLADDPRPSYQNDPERIYSMRFAGYDIHFRVNEMTLTVIAVDN